MTVGQMPRDRLGLGLGWLTRSDVLENAPHYVERDHSSTSSSSAQNSSATACKRASSSASSAPDAASSGAASGAVAAVAAVAAMSLGGGLAKVTSPQRPRRSIPASAAGPATLSLNKLASGDTAAG